MSNDHGERFRIEIHEERELNEQREVAPAYCMQCDRLIGFIGARIVADVQTKFNVDLRLACDACGPESVTLALTPTDGELPI